MEEKIEEILNIVRNGKIFSVEELNDRGYDVENIFEGHIQERRKLNIYIRDNIRKRQDYERD